MKLKLSFLAFTMVIAMQVVASPTVQNVTAKQRFPWNGKVDIKFIVNGDIAASAPSWNPASLVVIATNQVTGESWIANNLVGDTGIEEGEHNVVWDMSAQGLKINSSDIQFMVSFRKVRTYCVIDISQGTTANKYPVCYLPDVPSGGWTEEYKTTKLVFRLIEPGSFKMCGQNDVTITKPYYIGVFEVTQKQFKLIMGSNPSQFVGDTLPVDNISWADICVTGQYSGGCIKNKLASKTGLQFNLPTEAQWEYSYRAGTTTAYYWGDSMNGEYAWYKDNSSSTTHPVGMRQPNANGLYDMSGNIEEWCLDQYHSSIPSGIDPFRESGSNYKVLRGGFCLSDVKGCTANDRGCHYPYAGNLSNYYCGFRLAMQVVE